MADEETTARVARLRHRRDDWVVVSVRIPGRGTVRYASPRKREAVDAVMSAVAVLTGGTADTQR